MFQEGLPPEFSEYIQSQAAMVARALLSLPLAAVLGSALAFRPRRRGTPPRSAPVIQTQIILAIIGAAVMLIVGESFARAFGIVGVASLIRYRTKVEDPKDSVVMLGCLTVGLASGVGLYGLAAFATVFILGVLWVVESFEPQSTKTFELKVTGPEPSAIRKDLEALLRRHDITYELRSAGHKELVYETELPFAVRTDRVSNAILRLQPNGEIEVVWDQKKKK